MFLPLITAEGDSLTIKDILPQIPQRLPRPPRNPLPYLEPPSLSPTCYPTEAGCRRLDALTEQVVMCGGPFCPTTTHLKRSYCGASLTLVFKSHQRREESGEYSD